MNAFQSDGDQLHLDSLALTIKLCASYYGDEPKANISVYGKNKWERKQTEQLDFANMCKCT